MLSVGTAVLALAVIGLLPGRPVHDAVSSGERDTFLLDVPVRQFVTGVIEQGDNDLIVTVVSPAGLVIGTFDQRERNQDFVAFVTDVGGRYRILVTAAAAATRRAKYSIRFHPFRLAAPEDERFVEGVALLAEAKQLAARGDRGSLSQALERLAVAQAFWRELNVPWAELVVLTRMGDTQYALSDYAAADTAYRAALSLVGDLGDASTELEVRINLGVVQWRLGNIPEALDLLEDAASRGRAIGSNYLEAAANSNRGVIQRESGAYDEARQHFARALTLIRTLGNRVGEAAILNSIGVVLDDLGRGQEALAYLRNAVHLFRQAGDRLNEGRALLWQARVQFGIGRRVMAKATAERGLALIQGSGNRLAEADALRHLGRIVGAGDAVAAASYYVRALALYREIGSRRGQADVMSDLAGHHLAARDASAAIPMIDGALEIRRALGLRRLEADTLVQMAHAVRLLGDLPGAQARLEQALDIVEQLRGTVLERHLRASYLGSKDSYYAEYVDVLVERHRREPAAGFAGLAFEAAERRRARDLNERLRESWEDVALVTAPEILQEERRRRREINYWSLQLWQQADRPEAKEREQALRARLDGLLSQYAEVEARFRRAVPGYAASARADVTPVAMLQRESIDRDTVVLQYMLGEQRSHVWAVTSSSVDVFELPLRSLLESRARAFHRLVSAGPKDSTDPGAPQRVQADAVTLGRLLLGPAASTLNRRRVVVIPDGALHYVPMSALVHPTTGVPLIVSSEVITIPSATTLSLLRYAVASRVAPSKTLAVLADAVFDRLDPRVRSGVASPSTTIEPGPIRRRLSRLPFSRREAEDISSLVPVSHRLMALGFEATRALATSAEMSQYRVIHFASHAVQDDERPSLSGIVLSLVGPDGEDQDGFLRLHELYTLALRADLVVLSACETALGREAGGEGLASLANGFLNAGAARVVSTLWKVDDEATATMMRFFYQALFREADSSPAAALRSAQHRMLTTRFRHPFYWSGFVIHGDW